MNVFMHHEFLICSTFRRCGGRQKALFRDN